MVRMQVGSKSQSLSESTEPLAKHEFVDEFDNLYFCQYPIANDSRLTKPILTLQSLGRSDHKVLAIGAIGGE